MDPHLYKNEIDRLTKEISSMKEETEKVPINIWAYKYYFLIVIFLGFVIYIIKPKCTLTIQMNDEDDESVPEIVLSKKYFVICWAIASIIFCIAYYIFNLYKKKQE